MVENGLIEEVDKLRKTYPADIEAFNARRRPLSLDERTRKRGGGYPRSIWSL